jgi:hypothetical protein
VYGTVRVPSAMSVMTFGSSASIRWVEAEPAPLPVTRMRRLRRSAAGSAALVPPSEPICT